MDYRSHILFHADQLFASLGIRRVTMQDIANRSGVSKVKLYEWFADKETLVDEWISGKLTERQQLLLQLKAGAADAVDAGLKIAAHFIDWARLLNPSLMREFPRYYPVQFARITAFRTGFLLELLRENIVQGIEEGFFRRELNIGELVLMQQKQLEFVYQAADMGDDEVSGFERMALFMQFFLYGISTIKGHQLLDKYLNISAS
jgi:AcrR family transcriptional regulator